MIQCCVKADPIREATMPNNWNHPEMCDFLNYQQFFASQGVSPFEGFISVADNSSIPSVFDHFHSLIKRTIDYHMIRTLWVGERRLYGISTDRKSPSFDNFDSLKVSLYLANYPLLAGNSLRQLEWMLTSPNVNNSMIGDVEDNHGQSFINLFLSTISHLSGGKWARLNWT